MKHIWSILCKKSIIDSETNNISISEALEEINFHIPTGEKLNLPANFNFDFEIVSFWTSDNPRGGEKFYMEIESVDPDQKIIAKFEQKIIFPEDKKRLRTRIKTPTITVTKEGEYIFKIKAKEKKEANFKTVAEIPLAITLK